MLWSQTAGLGCSGAGTVTHRLKVLFPGWYPGAICVPLRASVNIPPSKWWLETRCLCSNSGQWGRTNVISVTYAISRLHLVSCDGFYFGISVHFHLNQHRQHLLGNALLKHHNFYRYIIGPISSAWSETMTAFFLISILSKEIPKSTPSLFLVGCQQPKWERTLNHSSFLTHHII